MALVMFSMCACPIHAGAALRLHATASAAEVNKENCAQLNGLGHEVLRFLESTGEVVVVIGVPVLKLSFGQCPKSQHGSLHV